MELCLIFLKKLKFPIYATPLALAMIGNKFDEHGLSADKKYFRYVTKRKQYQIGDLKVEWIHATHSIVDASSLAIETPAGTLIHTADFTNRSHSSRWLYYGFTPLSILWTKRCTLLI